MQVRRVPADRDGVLILGGIPPATTARNLHPFHLVGTSTRRVSSGGIFPTATSDRDKPIDGAAACARRKNSR